MYSTRGLRYCVYFVTKNSNVVLQHSGKVWHTGVAIGIVCYIL